MKKYLLIYLLSIISICSFSQNRPIKQYTILTTGTVAITDAGQDIDLIHNAGATSTLTITFPSNPYDNQRVLISSQNGITTLTLTSTTSNPITNIITTMAAGASAAWRYNASPSGWLSVNISPNSAGGGSGTVTTFSVVTANGVSASVANPTTTPAATFTLGAITPTTVNGVTISGSSTPTLAVTGTTTVSGTHSGTSSGTNTGDQTNITGNAATVTTNANLTGAVTSSGNATSLGSFSSANLSGALTDETGTGVSVFGTSPTFTTGIGIGITPAAVLHLAQAMTAAAWTTTGIGFRIAPATYTDNTSSGTVTNNYVHTIGVPTLATSSATTFTNVATLFVDAMTAGTVGNTTVTNPYSIVANGSIKLINSTPAIVSGGNLNIQSASGSNSITLQQGASTKWQLTTLGNYTFAGTAQSSGANTFLTFTAPAHTSQTTATEITDVNYDLSAILKSVDGTIATNRTFRIQGRTLTPQTSALTVTNPVTLDVTPPVAGSGTTFTNNPMAIRSSGNISLSTAGNGIYIKEGTNATMGVATLSGGTVVVSTTKVTANSRIFLEVQALGTVSVATPVAITARSAGTSFTISSSNVTDTSIIAWYILEPAP